MFQMFQLPHLAIAAQSTEKGIGINSYPSANGYDFVEFLPPANPQPIIEFSTPALPVCTVLDHATHRVSRIESFIRPENHPNYLIRQSVVYEDYRIVDGVEVPFTQKTYRDGLLYKTLHVDSVAFNVGVSPSEFVGGAQ